MCVDFLITQIAGLISPPSVKRVHWLRARAPKGRWHEEVILVTYEMQWTVRYFLHKSNKWEEGAHRPNVSPGAKAYALWQGKMWRTLANVTNMAFKGTKSQYMSPTDVI